jgi:phosphohistidine phosphatase
MKTLYLLRHAKSAWDDAALDDHDRPLAPRGRSAGKALARRLTQREVRPQLVLCSTAARARETLSLIAGALEGSRILYEPRLYHASLESLRHRVADLPGECDEVLMVGHNPGFHDLALDLTEPGPLRDRITAKLPTGALVTITGTVDTWDALAAGRGTLSDLVLPRDL